MGHQIEHLTYSYKTSTREILDRINGFAYDPHESSGYHGNLTFHENRIYANYDEALKAIEKFDNGWYSDHAVLFYDFVAKPTKKMEDINRRIQEYRTRITEYNKKHSIKNLKSEFVSCPNCGSKLKRELLNDYYCPVCRKSFKPELYVNTIKSYEEKIQELNISYRTEAGKVQAPKNANVSWLVKVEWHC